MHVSARSHAPLEKPAQPLSDSLLKLPLFRRWMRGLFRKHPWRAYQSDHITYTHARTRARGRQPAACSRGGGKKKQNNNQQGETDAALYSMRTAGLEPLASQVRDRSRNPVLRGARSNGEHSQAAVLKLLQPQLVHVRLRPGNGIKMHIDKGWWVMHSFVKAHQIQPGFSSTCMSSRQRCYPDENTQIP